MDMETLNTLRAWAYIIVTLLLIVFLYSYAVFMWRKQKKGTIDYEKYGSLAVNDSLEDEIVEPRETNKRSKDELVSR